MGRRSRRNAEMTQALAVFAAGLEGRVQTQLDALAHMQATITELLLATRSESERRDSDLVRALDVVAGVCEHAVDAITAERGEREAFLELLAEFAPLQLEHRPSTPATASKVLGGSVVISPMDVDLVGEELADT
jgi:hypothetical protein